MEVTMPCVKKPVPLPSELDYVPENSAPYQVTSKDNWWTLADRPEVVSAGMSANDLCYFNFKTRNPAEINWYLYHKVGCRKVTGDGKNYMFDKSDDKGIVYLPKIGPPPPVNELDKHEDAQRTNTWFGLAVKAGTQFVVVGIETLGGYVASLDDFGKGMAVGASINRVGPGWGVGAGVSFIFISGVSRPADLKNYQEGSWDFNVSLGENWGKAATATAKLKKFGPLIDFIKSTGARTPQALKSLLKADPDKWAELIKAGRSVHDFLGIDPRGEPSVFVFDVPYLSGGVEASVFYGLSNYEAVWDMT
jgi:hypothetical protein